MILMVIFKQPDILFSMFKLSQLIFNDNTDGAMFENKLELAPRNDHLH